ncbi:hypothetical protein BT63DRAFT_116606 [Microthyrium microscopicum]|uniref:Diaminohydroxyphosphoribosylamino-pyrimidine deaminase n=1 Tax=Microthyrium microscopicum TaxID=703497 RepID=A0A6A6TV74_9PEZI|nr:hypothetical protein BT63DRAFT_116606 [Microthyrium microscopicum]
MDKLLPTLGTAIDDTDQEAFLVFSQDIPSNSLGFVDSKSSELDISISGKDFVIKQSPGVLNSNRKQGTTGAVLWQVSPRFAEWVSAPSNFLFTHGVLNDSSVVLELGCGISGIIALALSPKIGTYICTDQAYVLKQLKQNITDNIQSSKPKSVPKVSRKRTADVPTTDSIGNVTIKALDWETDSINGFLSGLNLTQAAKHVQLVVACDCIYNEALVDPLVDTCADICKLAPADSPTICIFAQQLRSPDVFECWLKAFHAKFQVWRLEVELLSKDLSENSGFVVHVGILRD